MTYTEAAPDCNKGMGTAAKEAAQGYPIQYSEAKFAEPNVTHHTDHTADHPHTAAHQVTILRTVVYQIHAYPTNHQNVIYTTEAHTAQGHTPTWEPRNHTFIGIEKLI